MPRAPHKQKLYCYVDETGQHTDGRLFFVAVVIVGEDRDTLRRELSQIEESSGKYAKKWTRATQKERENYMRSVLASPLFTGTLFYSMYPDTRAYVDLTILSVAKAIRECTVKEDMVLNPYMTTVFVDGLRSRLEEHRFGRGLRQLGISARKVRGLDDQSDQFIRLADALAAFVRDSLDGHERLRPLYGRALVDGKLTKV
jgi:hypothetical protein